MRLTHIVGRATKHSYEPSAKQEVARIMERLANRGRRATPSSVIFSTRTLRYHSADWLRIDGLGEHWKPAEVVASFGADSDSFPSVEIVSYNVAAISLDFPSGTWPGRAGGPASVRFYRGEDDEDGVKIDCEPPATDRSWQVSFHKESGTWKLGPPLPGLRKKHGLQGPIDDAFLDSFVIVEPTGTSKNEKVAAWVKAEGDRAVRRWRTQMRGDAA